MKILTKTFPIFAMLLVTFSSCKKFLEIPLPVNQIAGDGAYLSDNSAGAASTGNFTTMYTSLYFNGAESIQHRTALYADDLRNLFTTNTQHQAFYTDDLQSSNVGQWSSLYNQIWRINTTIEGLNASTAVLEHKNQWLGESYFLRAWMFFYLQNLYGDLPLATTSDLTTNNNLSRSPKEEVYKQIISDLLKAQSMLPENYSDGFGEATNNRVRPNKWAATALLARAYLYNGNWADAATQATAVINQAGTYHLESLDSAFLIGSHESVWELALVSVPGATIQTVYDYALYNFGTPADLGPGKTPFDYRISFVASDELLQAFEPGDQRFSKWLRPVVAEADATHEAATYYLINKYRAAVVGVENAVQMRFAELYLIRAEARAQQGNDLDGARADINMVRARAGLAGTKAGTREALLAAILQERRVEYFTEGGHRFFDLKRTGNIDAVMSVVTPRRGGTWNSNKQLWPLPTNDLQQDLNLHQNPGYQN
ncbi:MAG TPA: RagB/SusD family nutrient uptake outer membrane protein [Chitinophaga sp.]